MEFDPPSHFWSPPQLLLQLFVKFLYSKRTSVTRPFLMEPYAIYIYIQDTSSEANSAYWWNISAWDPGISTPLPKSHVLKNWSFIIQMLGTDCAIVIRETASSHDVTPLVATGVSYGPWFTPCPLISFVDDSYIADLGRKIGPVPVLSP